ncbi:PP2C family protein-serine/threonine phosphatase [Thermodesulfobacteriota bacterium]
MSKARLFVLKNRMLIANGIANLVGVLVVTFLMTPIKPLLTEEMMGAAIRLDTFFIPSTFILVWFLTVVYELPIRRYLDSNSKRVQIPAEIALIARRRLLNEPFVLIAIDIGMWIGAASLYSGTFYMLSANSEIIHRAVFFKSIATGLITVTVAFFALEFVLQRFLAPIFFPEGGLSRTPKTLRIRIRTRLIALFVACNLIPLVTIHTIIERTKSIGYDAGITSDYLRSTINANSLIFLAVGIWLTFLVSSNLSRPFANIIRVLQGVRRGNFERKVRVTTNDEIGYTSDAINEMTEGLKERDRMRQALDLAMEVQQNLLPTSDPKIGGLDIAGRSIYCDETGGDYYDFLQSQDSNNNQLSVVVGDVSDHGIPSALLMATARAFLRQRYALPGSPAEIITDINYQLARDVGKSGQFMTMFYLSFDKMNKQLKWVRAGHDPAIFYNPAEDTFEDLRGSGIALGLDEDWRYTENEKSGLSKGQIVLLGTDGIWEAQNDQGEMFSKEPIYSIIRQNSSAGAKDILEGILEALKQFQNGRKPEDDVTLVVVKINDDL